MRPNASRATFAFPSEHGADPTRVSVLAVGDAASGALRRVLAAPAEARSLVLVAPTVGPDPALGSWPGTPVLALATAPLADELARFRTALTEAGAAAVDAVVLPGEAKGADLHADAPGARSRIERYLRATLLEPDLRVPHFAADDERAGTAGFVAETLRLTRRLREPERAFTLMLFAVGERITAGAMVRQEFRGDVAIELGDRTLAFAWDTAEQKAGKVRGMADPPTVEPGSFRGVHWANVELPLADVVPLPHGRLRLVFRPAGGEPVALPDGGASFATRLVRR
jgi:hypothetical protein